MIHLESEFNHIVALKRNRDGIICLFVNNEEVAYFEDKTGHLVLLPRVFDTGVPIEMIDSDGYLLVCKAKDFGVDS